MTDSLTTLGLPSTNPMQEDHMTPFTTPDDARPAGAPTAVLDRTRMSLLAYLDLIDVHGWDSPAGCALLSYVRDNVVRPQVSYHGLTGPVAAQAEATAWTMTWRTLTSPRIRDAESPWGILWSAARRAIEDESIAAAYGTQPRKAWQQRASQRLAARSSDPGPVSVSLPPLSWEHLSEHGFEPASCVGGGTWAAGDAPILTAVVAVLLEAGWQLEPASRALLSVAARSRHRDGRPHVLGGYRGVAADATIPGWQARRLVHVLLGAQEWPGLIERFAARSDRGAIDAVMLGVVVDDVDPGGSLARPRRDGLRRSVDGGAGARARRCEAGAAPRDRDDRQQRERVGRHGFTVASDPATMPVVLPSRSSAGRPSRARTA
jgi:hypothetical protein